MNSDMDFVLGMRGPSSRAVRAGWWTPYGLRGSQRKKGGGKAAGRRGPARRTGSALRYRACAEQLEAPLGVEREARSRPGTGGRLHGVRVAKKWQDTLSRFEGIDNLRTHATNTDRRRQQTGRGAFPEEALEAVGAVSFRAAVGNGARGLQRGRHGVGIFSSRSCAFASLSMGRRRNWRHQRSPSDDLFWFGDVEWARFHFEGTAVWLKRARRQSWGGCEGAVFLFGFDADA